MGTSSESPTPNPTPTSRGHQPNAPEADGDMVTMVFSKQQLETQTRQSLRQKLELLFGDHAEHDSGMRTTILHDAEMAFAGLITMHTLAEQRRASKRGTTIRRVEPLEPDPRVHERQEEAILILDQPELFQHQRTAIFSREYVLSLAARIRAEEDGTTPRPSYEQRFARMRAIAKILGVA